MIFSYHEINQLPVMVIDKFYDSAAEQKIMQELLFLNNDPRKLQDPENTGSAWDPDDNLPGGKKYLKQNKGHSLDSIYHDRNVSNILVENRKLFSEEVTNELTNTNALFRYVKHVNADATLISYYEDSDFYLPHHDSATITAITWFYQEPKSFLGGELVLENSLEIDCVTNRCVIFPSIMLHAVKEIKIGIDKKGMNFGRFAISQFLSYHI